MKKVPLFIEWPTYIYFFFILIWKEIMLTISNLVAILQIYFWILKNWQPTENDWWIKDKKLINNKISVR